MIYITCLHSNWASEMNRASDLSFVLVRTRFLAALGHSDKFPHFRQISWIHGTIFRSDSSENMRIASDRKDITCPMKTVRTLMKILN